MLTISEGFLLSIVISAVVSLVLSVGIVCFFSWLSGKDEENK